MGIESATFIGDFVATNPTSSDLRSQGDDQIRLIKTVLQNSFPSLEKAIYFPSVTGLSADYTIQASDDGKLFLVDTTGGPYTFTLPNSMANGMKVRFFKYSNDSNPMYIKQDSGNIRSGFLLVPKARRCIPGAVITAYSGGGAWIVDRAVSVPIGALLETQNNFLPSGYEWPNGQTLNTTNYPEYFVTYANGVTMDKRGRLGIPLDNLGGSAAGRLPSGVISGSTFGAVGGADAILLALSQIPTGIISANASQNITVTSSISTIVKNTGTLNSQATFGGGPEGLFADVNAVSMGNVTSSGNNSITTTSTNTGGQPHANLQPSIMNTQILVVE